MAGLEQFSLKNKVVVVTRGAGVLGGEMAKGVVAAGRGWL